MERKTKPKKCKVCAREFYQERMGQRVCGWQCGLKFGRDMTEKSRKVLEKAERIADKAKKESLKRLGELRKEAQAAFNAYIRERDRGQPCICCGKPLGTDWLGGAYDAGHYLSRGSAPHLAFDERNVNAQNKSCNRPGGTTRAKFRAGMIERWGLDVVEALEADQTERRYRHDDYRRIRDEYRAKTRALQREKEPA